MVEMKIITIIPAFNEENSIGNVVRGALKYSDVLVVDDGSTDNTSNLAKKSGAYVIKHVNNAGKGAAIKSGLNKAINDGYDIIILMDGDGQHNPHHIPQLISDMDNLSIVIGSRFKNGVPKNMPKQRKLSNKITTKIIQYITGYKITDSQSGFRAFSSDIAKHFLEIRYDDYVYESEMLYRAFKNNIRIKEVSIPAIYSVEKSHIKTKHALNYIIYTLSRLIDNIKN
jgi:glycosyltransferase involved in cell wall biosynthesis